MAHLVRLGRVHPELPASAMFDQVEWQAAWLLADQAPALAPTGRRRVVIDRPSGSLSGPGAVLCASGAGSLRRAGRRGHRCKLRFMLRQCERSSID
ncbi:hypothetical protein [Azoarcus olearius]|uniref:hypothetical protein n=1 Tax=Azoarcus sp. (strain BH72) TaxID=418699 RepID=UPI0039BFB62B